MAQKTSAIFDDMECLFCKIIAKEIPARFIYESDLVVAFPDSHPSADLHFLVVPKKHLAGLPELNDQNGDLLVEVYKAVNQIVRENNLQDSLYRVVVNGGRAQQISHLHFHLLGGKWKKFV